MIVNKTYGRKRGYPLKCGEMGDHTFDKLTQACSWCGLPLVHLIDPPKLKRITRDTPKTQMELSKNGDTRKDAL